MNAPDLNRQPYRRPPLVRATDPQRMNWLWRLLCEVAGIRSAEVVEALHALQIPVDRRRVRSWSVSDDEDSFSSLSIAELERNLRALLVLRTARREDGDVLDDDAADEHGEPDVGDYCFDAPGIKLSDEIAVVDLAGEERHLPASPGQTEGDA